jgi:hypothetical protein
MRDTVSTVFRYAGLALGLVAGGLLIALQWPDVTSDLHNVKAVRHIVGMFTGGIVLACIVGWPFWWAADRLSPGDETHGADAGMPT